MDFFTLRRWVGHIDEEALKIYVHIADEQAQQTMRQLSERREADRFRAAGKRPGKARRAAGAKVEPAKGRHGVSKVMEVKNDSLRDEPWKPAQKLGMFDSTFSNQRRGRDSPGPLHDSFGFSAIPDAMSMPDNEL